ncbi:MAG: LysE family translocator [Actinomycetota bacterium]
MSLTDLVALVLFAAAGSVSPGPNNTLLLASGVRFGFARTIPHVIGSAIGIGVLSLLVGLGIGAAIEAIPAAQLVLKLLGSAYFFYLAFRIARGSAVTGTDVATPLTVSQAVVFQFVNPKGWIFVIALVGAFLPPDMEPVAASALVATVVAVVVLAAAAVWALGGAALSSILGDDRSRQAVTDALAVLMVASVAFLWL